MIRNYWQQFSKKYLFSPLLFGVIAATLGGAQTDGLTVSSPNRYISIIAISQLQEPVEPAFIVTAPKVKPYQLSGAPIQKSHFVFEHCYNTFINPPCLNWVASAHGIRAGPSSLLS